MKDDIILNFQTKISPVVIEKLKRMQLAAIESDLSDKILKIACAVFPDSTSPEMRKAAARDFYLRTHTLTEIYQNINNVTS